MREPLRLASRPRQIVRVLTVRAFSAELICDCYAASRCGRRSGCPKGDEGEHDSDCFASSPSSIGRSCSSRSLRRPWCRCWHTFTSRSTARRRPRCHIGDLDGSAAPELEATDLALPERTAHRPGTSSWWAAFWQCWRWPHLSPLACRSCAGQRIRCCESPSTHSSATRPPAAVKRRSSLRCGQSDVGVWRLVLPRNPAVRAVRSFIPNVLAPPTRRTHFTS